MGGVGSGSIKKKYATREEYAAANRENSKKRYHRLRAEKLEGKHPKTRVYQKKQLEKYHNDEERIGHLRETSRGFKVDEDPKEYLKEIREKNKKVFDDIMSDDERWRSIFKFRDDLPNRTKVDGRRKHHLSDEEIKEKREKLEREFNLVEDRRPSQSTYKKTTDEEN